MIDTLLGEALVAAGETRVAGAAGAVAVVVLLILLACAVVVVVDVVTVGGGRITTASGADLAVMVVLFLPLPKEGLRYDKTVAFSFSSRSFSVSTIVSSDWDLLVGWSS